MVDVKNGDEPTSEKKGFDYKEWYEKNKERLREKRRRRYREDPKYREKAKAQAKLDYWTRRRKVQSEEEKALKSIEPVDTMSVRIQNEDDARVGTTVEVPVYTAGQLGKLLYNRTAQTMRLWEKEGVIPPAKLRNNKNHRMYTQDEIEVYASHRALLKVPAKSFYKDNLFSREIWKDLEQMPDGVEPVEVVTVLVECTDPFCRNTGTAKVPEDADNPVVLCEHCGGRMKIL